MLHACRASQCVALRTHALSPPLLQQPELICVADVVTVIVLRTCSLSSHKRVIMWCFSSSATSWCNYCSLVDSGRKPWSDLSIVVICDHCRQLTSTYRGVSVCFAVAGADVRHQLLYSYDCNNVCTRSRAAREGE